MRHPKAMGPKTSFRDGTAPAKPGLREHVAKEPAPDHLPAKIPVRTVEQLSILRAMRVLERFTFAQLGGVAGIRVGTVRSLLSRWEAKGLRLIEEVGVEHAPGVGQPPKIHVLASGMAPIIEASINKADHLPAVPSKRAVQVAPPIDQLNLLDAAMDMVTSAEKTPDPRERDKLVTEARRLIGECRVTLARRVAAGRGGASATLEKDLQKTEQRIASIAEKLKIIIEHCAAALTKSRPSNDEWLSSEASYYLRSGPSGQDAEVGFFAGFLVARGSMGETQDTSLDRWLFRVAAQTDRDARAPADLPWEPLQKKFANAFGRIVDCGARNEWWNSLLKRSLEGIANNAHLAIIPEIHDHVARLIRETASDTLRQAGEEFLQQYSRDAAATANVPMHHTVDSYYADYAKKLKALEPMRPSAAMTAAWEEVPLTAIFLAAFRPELRREPVHAAP